jgi:N-acetylmuramoyl-L-alanine amidase
VYGGGGTGCQPAAPAAGFRDVTPKHWAYATLQQAAALGLLQGYPDGTLRPDGPVSRAEAAALLSRLIGAAGGTPITAGGTPITAGGTPITAGGAPMIAGGAPMIAGGAPMTAGAAPFADVAPAYWAAGDISRLYAAGLVDGVMDKLYMPERPMTRAEMAALLDRYTASHK